MPEIKEAGADEGTGIDESAFLELEKEFQDVLSQLTSDETLGKFRIEYEKIYQALRKTHDSETRLMMKCRELNSEIIANAAKVSTALKLSQEDQTTISNLKMEIEKAWKMVDVANDKELKARDTIAALKTEISNLSKLVEMGAGLTTEDFSVQELVRQKNDLIKERDEQLNQITQLRQQLSETEGKLQDVEKNMASGEDRIFTLENDLQTRSNEAQREERKKERMEHDLKQVKAELEGRSAELKILQAQTEKQKNEKHKLEQQLKDQRILNERAIKDADLLNQRFIKLQAEYEAQIFSTEQLSQENQTKITELKLKEDEVTAMKHEAQRLTKMRETIQRKLRQVEDQKSELDGQKDTLKTMIVGLERELDSCKKQMEIDKKTIDDLIRERDILSKNMLKAASATQKQLHLVRRHEQSKKTLSQEINNYKDEAQKQRKIIYQLEKERDRYINEASDLTQKVLQHMEDIKIREMQIFDYKKKIAEAETKLKQQQNLYEAVRSDRNLYSKNLIESQDEITEMKRKLKIMSHQIDQLKEEILNKETALVKEHLERQRVDKEKDTIKAELQKLKQQSQEAKAYIEAQEAEERKLLKIISEADMERLRQKKELDQVINERDILGTQLVRRNDELALLYEKIKIQQSVLSKGEVQYNQRMEDIRLLKLEVKKNRREKALLRNNVANLEDLRKEVFYIQRELLRERTRCKALEEELENPMNVHRWRKLEGNDPSRYEMITKVHMLQKRLISKTEEVVEKELLIQEKEKLYIELKHILARQPGPEVAEQLSIYQRTLKMKTKQLKAMSAELNMYETQVSEYQFETNRMANELQQVKKKYFMQKRSEQQNKERERIITGSNIITPQKSEGPRFTGGGFNISATIRT